MPPKTRERPRPNGGAPKTTLSHQPSATSPSVAPPSETRLEAALDYLARGWSILPLKPGGKEPYGPLVPLGWERFHENAATDEEVRDWFARFPDINLGILAGEVSQRLALIDIDYGDKANSNGPAMPEALREYVESLDTPVVWTPSGGLHIYARSGRLAELGNDNSLDVNGTTVELRARKGYVVAPPSVLTNGSYRFARPLEGLALASAAEVLTDLDALCKQLPDALAPSSSTTSSTTRGKGSAAERKPASKPKPQNLREAQGLETWDADREFVEAVKTLLGIPVRVNWERGTSPKFCCVLHEEEHPSASLFQTQNGVWVYADHHQREPQQTVYPLVDVYARAKHGVRRRLTPNQRALWKLRLMAHVDILKVHPGDLERPRPPNDLSRDGLVLLRDFALLQALKWSYRPEWRGDPSAFARSFAARWCGLPERRFDSARSELEEKGLLIHVGSLVKGKTKLFNLPAYADTEKEG